METNPTATPDVAKERAEATAAERARISSIRQIGELAGMDSAAIDKGVSDGITEDAFRKAAFDHLRTSKPIVPVPTGEVVRDARETFREAAPVALLFRSGRIDQKQATTANPAHEHYLGSSLEALAREALIHSGANVNTVLRMQKENLFAEAMKRSGCARFQGTRASGYNHSTSDFPYILANVANKSLQAAYNEAPSTYQFWTRKVSLADFKTKSVTALSGLGVPQKIYENGEIGQSTLSERREQYAASTYAQMVSITRQTLVNDDLDAFTRIPALQGAAARRMVNMLVYGILFENSLTGETMADTYAIFDDTNHSNYTSSGTALSVTSLGVANAKMAKQTGLASEKLNLKPAFLIVPPELYPLASQVIGSNVDPAKNNSTINPFFNAVTVIQDAFVNGGYTGPSTGTAYDTDNNHWFLAASPSQIDTIEVGFLNGVDAPSLDEEMGFDVLGMKLRSYIDVGAKCIDYRGLYRNAGA